MLSDDIEWSQWVSVSTAFLDHVDVDSWSLLSLRFRYGELRLSTLDLIYLVMHSCSVSRFCRGFISRPSWHRIFFAKRFAWLLGVFAYLSVILSAMQVGTSMDELQQNRCFRLISQVFAAGTIIGLLIIPSTMFLIWVVLVGYHVTWAIMYDKAVERKKSARTNSNA